MNLMYLPTKNKFHSNDSAVSLSLAAVFMCEKAEQDFLESCRNISFKRLTTCIGHIVSVPEDFHQKETVDVLLVEVDISIKEDLKHLQSLLEKDFKTIPVIVTAKDVTLNVARELMHMGVVDVLPQPFVEEDILTVLKRADEKNIGKEVHTKKGKVISFIKGGGGVGATTLAVQSGCFLSRKLSEHGMDVSLLDLDIQFGTAGLYLDMQNDDGLMAILAAKDRMDGTLLQGVFNKHESTGLKVLTIPRDVMPMDLISDETILRTLNILREEHQFTLVDMPGFWSSWSATVLKNSDMIILVTEIGISAISQAKRQLDTLQAQGLGDIPIKIILNRFCDKTEKMFSIKEVEKVLGQAIDHRIPNDYDLVCDAENKGVPLMKISSRSKLDQSIQALICDVADELTGSEIRGYLGEGSPSFLERIGLGNVFTKK